MTSNRQAMKSFSQLEREVIEPGNCVACGTCLGLYPEQLKEENNLLGPKPVLKPGAKLEAEGLLEICPGYGIHYKNLNEHFFGEGLQDYVLGNHTAGYIGFSTDKEVRQGGASGGVLTAMLLHLFREGKIQGAVVIEQGRPEPWSARPIIATNEEEIKACAQSVYIPVMTNKILAEVAQFKGTLAYVGLPFQVAALRRLQQRGHQAALKIKFVFGPYKGTSFLLGAVESYVRSNGAKGLEDIESLKYRDGEWPGYLRINLKDGRVFRSPKFYYNYLIPFFITKESLISIDFANELTDVSVGDAWNPRFESQGQGFSVLLTRTAEGTELVREMAEQGLLEIELIEREELIRMHGHMIDFKKRGSFIRIDWLRRLGRKTPRYDYRPVRIGFSRYLVELVISLVIASCSSWPARALAERIPASLLGKLFDGLRRYWKFLSKPTKRKGISHVDYEQID